MKTFYSFLFICLCCGPGLLAQQAQWARGVGGVWMEGSIGMGTDAQGLVYSLWLASDSSAIELGGVNYPSVGFFHFLLACQDSSGAVLWAQQVEAFPQDLWVADDGKTYIVGILNQPNTTFDTIQVSGTGHFVAGFNPDGSGAFVSQLPPQVQSVSAVTFDEHGKVFVGGTYIDATTFGATNLPSVPDTTYAGLYLAQYDSVGNAISAEAYTTLNGPASPNGNNSITDLAADKNGNVFIVGAYEDQLNIAQFNMLGNNAIQDSMNAYIARRDLNGTYVFAEDIFSPGFVGIRSVTPDRDGGAFITGSMSRSTFFDTGVFPGSYGSMRGFIVRFDSVGNGLWGESISAVGFAEGADVASDDEGNVFLMGRYEGDSVRMATTFLMDDDTLDSYMARFSPMGQVDWVRETEVPAGQGVGFHIGVGPTGEVYGEGLTLMAGLSATIAGLPVQDFNTIGVNAGFLLKLADTLFMLPPDSVWPGDANYDLVANNQDLLAIGVGFGATGPPRANASLNWVGQPSVDWNDTLPGAVNYKHLDTDGNGTVNADDTLAINLNYGLTHNKNEGVQKTGPLLSYSFKTDSVQAGNMVQLAINYGTDTLPVSDGYGLAFSLNYDTTLVDPNSLTARFDTSWLGSQNVDMLTMYRNFPNEGRVDFALTRIDQINTPGMGRVAHVAIIMVDDLTGKTILSEPFSFSFSNVRANDAGGFNQDVSVGSDTVILWQDVGPPDALDPALEAQIKVYPQPAESWVRIETGAIRATGYTLYDLQGRLLTERKQDFTQTQITLSSWPSGIYLLQIHTPYGPAMRRIMRE